MVVRSTESRPGDESPPGDLAVEATSNSGGLTDHLGDHPVRAQAPVPRRSVSWRVASLAAVLTLVPLAVLTYTAVTLSSDTVRGEVQANVKASSRLEAQVVQVRVQGLVEEVHGFEGDPVMIDALGGGRPASRDLPVLQALMNKFLQSDPELSFVSIDDPSGRTIVVSPLTPATIGQDFSYRDWYRGVTRTGAPYVSSAYRTAAAGHPLVVTIAVPIRASAGSGTTAPVLGYMVVGYPLAGVEQFVQEFSRSQGIALTITDQRGVILAAPTPPKGLVLEARDPRVVSALAGRSGVTTINEKGRAVLSGFAPVAGFGWTVHADVLESTAFASMNDLRAAVVSTAGGLAVLLLLGSLLLGRAWRARDDTKAEVAVRAQELERANIELGRSNDELEQFAYVASHDLSEPLRAISGPISLVARRYQGQLDDEADQFIGFAVDGCQRMQKMIDDLLVYSRIGRLERSFEPTDCNLVVDTVLTALGPAISETGASIHVEQLPVVSAEATQLSQVFQNLIANALKFVATDVTPEVAVAVEPAGAQWRFTITDNGIGIDPAHRERIFAMFKRLHSREEYPGTGIGLALVKKIVERHGGRIGVEDAPNRTGTRFWFTLQAEEDR